MNTSTIPMIKGTTFGFSHLLSEKATHYLLQVSFTAVVYPKLLIPPRGLSALNPFIHPSSHVHMCSTNTELIFQSGLWTAFSLPFTTVRHCWLASCH